MEHLVRSQTVVDAPPGNAQAQMVAEVKLTWQAQRKSRDNLVLS
jgi:hypothetical protein